MTMKTLDPTSPEATHLAKTFEPSHYLMQIDGRDYLDGSGGWSGCAPSIPRRGSAPGWSSMRTASRCSAPR